MADPKSLKPRRNHSLGMKLDALGGGEFGRDEVLRLVLAFQALFAWRKSPYIVRRPGEGRWSRAKIPVYRGGLRVIGPDGTPASKDKCLAPRSRDDGGHWGEALDQDVLHHLACPHLETLSKLWVGCFSFGHARHMTVDVDNRTGDPQDPDFVGRCERLAQALDDLGIRPEDRLVEPTPGGGLHVTVVFEETYPVEALTQMFAWLGLIEKGGQFELYPSPKHGCRLPFGFDPNRRARSGRFCRWMKALLDGRIRRHSFEELYRRAESLAGDHRVEAERQVRIRAEAARREAEGGRDPWPAEFNDSRACAMGFRLDKIDRKRFTARDADELERVGVAEPGTRRRVCAVLAWHWVFARGMGGGAVLGRLRALVARPDCWSGDVRSNPAKVDLDLQDLVARLVRKRGARRPKTYRHEELVTLCGKRPPNPSVQGAAGRSPAFHCVELALFTVIEIRLSGLRGLSI